MSEESELKEWQFIWGVLNDRTNTNRRQRCRSMPLQAFKSAGARAAWRVLSSTKTMGEALLSPALGKVGMLGGVATDPIDNDPGLWEQIRVNIAVECMQDGGWDESITPRCLAVLRAPLDGRGGWPYPVSAFDLHKAPPPRPAVLIDRVLYQGGTLLLAAPSKARKSYALLQLAHAIATGGEWMDFECDPAPVLYVNLELSAFSILDRLDGIAKAYGNDPSRSLHMLNLRGHMVTIDSMEAHIRAEIERTQAKAVILDPFYKIGSASKVEENSNDGLALFLHRLEDSICSSGASLIMAHHFAKGDASSKNPMDRASGGGTFARWPDAFFTMTEHKEPDRMTCDMVLRCFAPVPSFVIRWDFPLWVLDEDSKPEDIKSKLGPPDKHPVADLIAALKDGMEAKEWETAIGWAGATFRRKYKVALISGKVRMQSGCFYHTAPQSPQMP